MPPRRRTAVPVETEYRPSLISRRRAEERRSAPEGRIEPMRERDVPERLRRADPIAAAVAYRMANGNWDRVLLDPRDPSNVIVQ